MTSERLTRATVPAVVTLVGDEVYLRDRYRAGLIELLPAESREFSLFDFDLATTPLDEVLDQARTPSLMADFQICLVRGAKELFSRTGAGTGADTGAETKTKSKRKHGDFPANLERFAREMGRPPAATVVFIADHLHLPADRQRLGLEDKGRLERIEATLGKCGELVMCARATVPQAAAIARDLARDLGATLAPETARELAELLEADLGLMRMELEKLALYAGPGQPIDAAAIAALVAGARTGSAFELAQRIAAPRRADALAVLGRIWAEEGDGGAIGLVFQLSRAFKMALIAAQERVRDRSRLYQVLPQGLRPPSFAADAVVAISRAMPRERLGRALELLHAADVELRSSPPSMRLVMERVVVGLT